MKKYFTFDEANQILPVIQQELCALQNIKREYDQKFRELQVCKMEYRESGNLRDSIFKYECELEFIQMEAHMHYHSMQNRGVYLKDIEAGLVVFPALIDGEEVLLCWKQGEDRITYYHGVYEGFSSRKSLQ